MEGRRVALLVATDRYQDSGLSRLAAPSGDVRTLAAVLGDASIAGFEITQLHNRLNAEVGRAIGDFYRDRRRDDLTLLYFTGHGIKDDYGQLYLAMTDTDRDNLPFTGVRGEQIRLAMEGCRSRRNVLILDCCYAGAFPAGSSVKGDTAVHALEQLGGRGSVVLTSSDATQYSFEGNHLTKTGPSPGPSSLFTRFLVEGLRTGAADLDGDGNITLDELYSYVHDRVAEERPQQRPKKKEDVEGRILIAWNIHWALPPHITSALGSPYAAAKLTALEELRGRYNRGNTIVQQRVLETVRELAQDDSKQVSSAASQFLSAVIQAEEKARREAEEKARREAEEQARREAEEQARREAEEQARREAGEQARREAGEQARREAEEQARREAEEKARREAEEKARREAEEKARREAEEKARREAEEKARREAEEKVGRDVIRGEAETHSRVGEIATSTPAPTRDLGEEAPQAAGRRHADGGIRRRLVLVASGAAVVVIGLIIAIALIPGRPHASGKTHNPAAPGTVRWVYAIGAPSNPAVAAGTVYFASRNNQDAVDLHALNVATGHLRWSYKTAGTFGLGGLAVSPAAANGTVYISDGISQVYALDAATGGQRWAHTIGGGLNCITHFRGNKTPAWMLAVSSSPAVADGTVYISSGCIVYALDATTGHLRWSYKYPGRTTTFTNPAVADGTVYISDGINQVYALDAGTGRQRWAHTTKGVPTSPAVANGTVYFGSQDHKVYALDAATGHQRWSYATQGAVHFTPAVANGTVYIGSQDHKVYALDAATGHQRWSYATQGAVYSTPAAANGTVYIGSQDHKVYALDAATGHLRWSYATQGAVYSTPAADNGSVYVGSQDNNAYALATGS